MEAASHPCASPWGCPDLRGCLAAPHASCGERGEEIPSEGPSSGAAPEASHLSSQVVKMQGSCHF